MGERERDLAQLYESFREKESQKKMKLKVTPPKVIIIAAGPTRTGKYWFRPNSKPKSLFHYNKEVILDHQLRVFKECGIKSFRLVTGYRSEDLVAYNKKNKLGLEIVYSPNWATDALSTIRVALKDMDEDVILVFADVIFKSIIPLKQFLASEAPLVCLYHGAKKGLGAPDAFKIDREKLPLMKRLEEYDYAPERKIDEGLRMGYTIWKLVESCGVFMYAPGLLIDVDFFGQTDEGGGIARRAKKR